MQLLKDAIRDKKFDVRMKDKLISDGKLTKEEIEKFLATLPDDSQNAKSDE